MQVEFDGFCEHSVKDWKLFSLQWTEQVTSDLDELVMMVLQSLSGRGSGGASYVDSGISLSSSSVTSSPMTPVHRRSRRQHAAVDDSCQSSSRRRRPTVNVYTDHHPTTSAHCQPGLDSFTAPQLEQQVGSTCLSFAVDCWPSSLSRRANFFTCSKCPV